MSDRTVAGPVSRLGVFGATGRMGQRVVALAKGHPYLELIALPGRGEARGAFDRCDVVVDFSVADATRELIEALETSSAALVTGVTGRIPRHLELLAERASVAPLFEAANFSVGVALLTALVQRAAAALPGADVEVFELHHRRKVDAPSGTALQLARAAAEARELGWPAGRGAPREGKSGPRHDDEVGLAALRGGDVIGEHTVYLIDQFERIELVHRAADRDLFAAGALRAAMWCVGRAPGRYSMADLISL